MPDAAQIRDLADLISTGGIVTMFIAVFVAGYYKRWCWGHELVEMTRDRDYWRDKYEALRADMTTEARRIDLEQRQLQVELIRAKLRTP